MSLEIRTGRDNKLYTLWHCNNVKDTFIKNLSTDFKKALKKAQDYAKKYNMLLEEDIAGNTDQIVRGKDVVRFGKFKDKRVSEVPSGYLHWILKGAPIDTHDYQGNAYTKELADEDLCKEAEKELISRGELIEFEGSYITPKYRDIILSNRNSKGHFFNEGDRIQINLLVKRITWFEGYYGTTWIYEFRDQENRAFFYKGSSCGLGNRGEWIELKGTIAHNIYNGEKQTMIKRPKVLQRAEQI